MESKMKNIIEEIEKNRVCPSCGGDYHEATCNYCGSENQTLKELENNLNTMLSETKNLSEEDLLSLYSIRTFQIPLVIKILEDTNYEEQIYQNLKDILKREEEDALTQEDYDHLFFFIQHPIFQEDISNSLIQILMEQLLLNKIDTTMENQLSLVQKFAEMFMKIKVPNPKVCFEQLEEDTFGTSKYDLIQFDYDKVVSCLKEKDYYTLLNTIFHECTHTFQNYLLKEGKVANYGLLQQAKERCIRKEDPNYYSDNYVKFSSEVDARYKGNLEILGYLNTLGLKLGETKEQLLFQWMAEEEALIEDESRIYQGKESSVGEIFNFLNKESSILRQYPILTLEYKVENGEVVFKTKEELKEDYENYRRGNSSFQMTAQEAEYLYSHLFSKEKKTK